MKIVIQRVKKASVSVSGEVVGKINIGLLLLIGIGEEDTEKEAETLAEKTLKLRIMADEKGLMNLSVKDVAGELLAVSQFTLYADTSGGNRPSFVKAAKPEKALPIYNCFVEKLKASGISVQTGRFGEYMEINAVLVGPVTILT